MTTDELHEATRIQAMTVRLENEALKLQMAQDQIKQSNEWAERQTQLHALAVEKAEIEVANEKLRTEMFQKILSGEIKLTA